MNTAYEMIHAFVNGFHNRPLRKHCIRADKKVREHLDETQVDNMVEESFPASDPPSNY